MEPKISKLLEKLEEKEELVDVFIGEGNKKSILQGIWVKKEEEK
jgi:hypothetical protein